MPATAMRKLLYKWAWDTRCRNVDVERRLRPLIDTETTILDAGCGEYGLSAFARGEKIVGVDVSPSDETSPHFSFVFGSIVSLPFSERSFSIAASVDVLEHLPEKIRAEAVRQLVNVAKRAIVITFPSGEKARHVDEDFSRALARAGQPIPDWLFEHLEHQYPETDAVVAEIEHESLRTGRKVRTTTYYSENLAVAEYLRRLAVRSKYLYLIGNLASGVLLSIFRKPERGTAYRSIIVAEFDND